MFYAGKLRPQSKIFTCQDKKVGFLNLRKGGKFPTILFA